jgi:hypothetical protein
LLDNQGCSILACCEKKRREGFVTVAHRPDRSFFLSFFHSLSHPPPRQGEYDLVELRAVFACAPEAFDLDADGEKKRWREQLVSE